MDEEEKYKKEELERSLKSYKEQIQEYEERIKKKKQEQENPKKEEVKEEKPKKEDDEEEGEEQGEEEQEEEETLEELEGYLKSNKRGLEEVEFDIYKAENPIALGTILTDTVKEVSCLDLAKKLEVDQKIVDALIEAGAEELEEKTKWRLR